MTTKAEGSHFSLVLEVPAADAGAANRHLLTRLSVETDPSDVLLDLQRGQTGFILIDARSAEVYSDCHIPSAINLPYRKINLESTAELPRDKVLVVYCWGVGCNASTKAAARLSGLGFKVKEMIGGLEYWRREGGPVEGTLGDDAPLVG